MRSHRLRREVSFEVVSAVGTIKGVSHLLARGMVATYFVSLVYSEVRP